MTEWKECVISDLGTVVGGATPSTKDPSNYEGGKIAWITPKDLSNYEDRYIAYGERNITEKGLNSCSAQLMPKHSVLFTSRAPIGYIAIAENEVCTNQGFKSIAPNENTDYLFLYYLLRYNRNKIEGLGSGTTFKEVSGSTMKGVEVKVPTTLSAQKAIGSFLNAIDCKIEENRRINKNLEQQAAMLIDNYCSATTNVINLGEIMSFENGFVFQSKAYLPYGRYRVITIKHVQDGKIDSQGAAYIDEIPSRMKQGCRLSIGDVLLSLTGNVGRVGIVYEENLLLNQRVAKFVPAENNILPWLYYYFRQPSTKVSLETIAKGTAQQNLSPIETLRLQIPFELGSARRLSEILLPMFDGEIANYIESLHLTKIRDALLPQLMSGELDISDIDL